MYTKIFKLQRQCSAYVCIHMYDRLPGLVKVFPSVSHSTGHTKSLAQGAGGYIHKLLLLKCA